MRSIIKKWQMQWNKSVFTSYLVFAPISIVLRWKNEAIFREKRQISNWQKLKFWEDRRLIRMLLLVKVEIKLLENSGMILPIFHPRWAILYAEGWPKGENSGPEIESIGFLVDPIDRSWPHLTFWVIILILWWKSQKKLYSWRELYMQANQVWECKCLQDCQLYASPILHFQTQSRAPFGQRWLPSISARVSCRDDSLRRHWSNFWPTQIWTQSNDQLQSRSFEYLWNKKRLDL